MQWSWKDDRGPSVWVSWKRINWDVDQEMLPTLFVMLGGDLTQWKEPRGPGKESKEVLAGSQLRVLISSHQEQTCWLCSEKLPICVRERITEKVLLEISCHAWACQQVGCYDSKSDYRLAHINHHVPS